jgi:hypothetical protein
MNMQRTAKILSLVLGVLCCPTLARASSLTLEWNANTDGVTTGYVLVYGLTSGGYTAQINVGNNDIYVLSGLSDATTYYIAVRAYDAAGNVSALSPEIAVKTPSAVVPVVTALSLISSLPSPQKTGTTVGWSATPTGGVAPYSYQWSLYHAGTSSVVAAWAPASTWTWTPTAAATDYQVSVAVRSAGSTSTTGEMTQAIPFTITAPAPAPTPTPPTAPTPPAAPTGVALSSNLAAPEVAGTRITFSAAAWSGVAPYQYEWWLYDGKNWRAQTSWTTSATWSWMPAQPNSNYAVRVWVRNAGNVGSNPNATASMPFSITAKRCQGGSKCN